MRNPSKWTAETPVLYDMKLDIKDSKGRVIDAVTQKIGFKETEIKDGVFYLNGRAVKLNAVNSHMQHPKLGHWVDEATIRKDMELLKKFNLMRFVHLIILQRTAIYNWPMNMDYIS